MNLMPFLTCFASSQILNILSTISLSYGTYSVLFLLAPLLSHSILTELWYFLGSDLFLFSFLLLTLEHIDSRLHIKLRRRARLKGEERRG